MNKTTRRLVGKARYASMTSMLTLVLSMPLVSACGEKLDPVQLQADGGVSDLENTAMCTTLTCPDGGVTYEGCIKKLTQQYCSNCHASDRTGIDRQGAPSVTNWDKYETAFNFASTIVSRVQNGSMPPTGTPSVPACHREKFQQWMEQGAK